MPDADRPSPETGSAQSDYRRYASALHEMAGRARSGAARESWDRLAACYERLAAYVERRRGPVTG